MLVVKVELHSAITGNVTELARAVIYNDGTEPSAKRGNYRCYSVRGRDAATLERRMRECGHHARDGEVKAYPRLRLHVWHLVARALTAMGYK